MRTPRPPLHWWLSHVAIGDLDDCWLWLAARDRNGYGKFQYGPKGGQTHVRAHRWIVEHLRGPIPLGMVVMHTCDNPPCVNPAHLIIGTPLQNNDDKVAKGRHAKLWGTPLKRSRQTHCKRGHEFTDANTHVNARGHRVCRTCARAASLRYYREGR